MEGRNEKLYHEIELQTGDERRVDEDRMSETRREGGERERATRRSREKETLPTKIISVYIYTNIYYVYICVEIVVRLPDGIRTHI